MPATTFQLPKPADIVSSWWGERDEIGAAYLELLEREPTGEERAAWMHLASETHDHARGVRAMFHVVETTDAEPYPSAREMIADMQRLNELRVSTANSDHPVWTPEQNVDFRIAHDGMGHYLSGGAFSWQGELDACGVHFRLVRSPSARRALFTECIGQIAAYYLTGDHVPQAIGFLPDYFTQGKLHG